MWGILGMCVLMELHITAQPAPVTLVFECFTMDQPFGASGGYNRHGSFLVVRDSFIYHLFSFSL